MDPGGEEMVKSALILFSVCLFAQSGSLGLLTGEWVAQSNASGIARVSIRTQDGRTILHSWGSCTPTDCDHGEVDLDTWNGIPMAIFKQGYSTRRMQLIPIPDGRLIVATERNTTMAPAAKIPAMPSSSCDTRR
jgi:hypothetical protein